MQIFDNPRDASRFIQNYSGELIVKLSGDILCNGEKIAEYCPDVVKCGFRRNK